jgi:hypothetical protein
VNTRFIRSAGYHPTSPRVTPDHHRLPLEIRVTYLLHRNKEGIQIDVQYLARYF